MSGRENRRREWESEKMSNPLKTYSSDRGTPELKTDEKRMKNWAKTDGLKKSTTHIQNLYSI